MTSPQELKLSSLIDSRGTLYPEFKRTLTPRTKIILPTLFAHHAAIGIILISIILAQLIFQGWPSAIVIGIMGGILLGYTLASLTNFFHEAIHYNLVPSNRELNDKITSLFISPLIGLDIKKYRPIHFAHHRHLGTPEDEEVSYFDSLNAHSLCRSLLLGKVLDMFVRGGRSNVRDEETKGERKIPRSALAINVAIVLTSAMYSQWALSLAWCCGIASFLPFFQSVRQTLEHRDYDAQDSIDYRIVPHGETTRLFGDGIIANTFGSAGFNRHLLHHWEPQISYTRLHDLEIFLLDTQAANIIKRNQTTYTQAFLKLFTWRCK